MTLDRDEFLMVLGYVLWSPSLDRTWQNRIYALSIDAEQAREKIVGHHPFAFVIRPVLLGAPTKDAIETLGRPYTDLHIPPKGAVR